MLVTTGPLASQNGFDNASGFQRAWSYEGTVFSVTVDIDRADPGSSQLDDLAYHEKGYRSFGHFVVHLTGAGDGALAVVEKDQKDKTHPLVRAEACSGNATVSVLVRVDGAVTSEADLTARSPAVIAALNDVLDDLRPRTATS
ncbi:hypothetical protein L3i22_050970 [Actinoplanes sp. L3-i22]|nr:hypothetical protein L3i22_050970 [Actinoplanes sp. L3-i22]